jgi:hypothetical protein
MKKIKTKSVLTLAALAFLGGFMASPASAEPMDRAERKCTSREEVNLSVTFENQIIEVKQAVTYIDDRIKEIEALAKESGVGEIELKGKTVNINSNQNKYRHQIQGLPEPSPTAVSLNGSANFSLENGEQAGAFIEALQNKGFNINFRMSMNRQCR